MYDYTVLDVVRVGTKSKLCLCGDDGRFHVARASIAVPQIGARLSGDEPALGFGLLLGALVDQVYRVTFEVVGCTQAEALNSAYGQLTP